ncbi:MAG: alpha/beta fold hydrolase, partial [Gammaproteobacteria bacterium]|nr:alpha/beta fold hydrolase [Gammaproteobacteria bacterium]
VGGLAGCYAELAHALDYPGAILGLQAHESVPVTLEQLAREHLQHMRRFQPEGPYVLGGWSMGGVLAYEIARQLELERQSVALLIMIDSFAPRARLGWHSQASQDRALIAMMAAELGIDADRTSAAAALAAGGPALLELLLDLGKQQRRLPTDFTLSELTEQLRVLRRNVTALHHYRGAPYRGVAVLIKAADNHERDPLLGWGRLQLQPQIATAPGTHFTMVRAPQAQHLARVLQPWISRTFLSAQRSAVTTVPGEPKTPASNHAATTAIAIG